MHARYLHGFGSGPTTAKGLALGRRLAGRLDSYAIPDLEAGDFPGLTMDLLAQRAAAAVAEVPDDGTPCLLIGSSLGGYAAALLAARGQIPRVGALLLIAPAFGFASRWQRLLGDGGIAAWRASGSRPFFHHLAQRDLPLGVGFLDSCLTLPELPGVPQIPVAIVHGLQDETVDHRFSVAYAAAGVSDPVFTPGSGAVLRGEAHPIELHLVQGDHRLTDTRHEDLIAWCAGDLLTRLAASA